MAERRDLSGALRGGKFHDNKAEDSDNPREVLGGKLAESLSEARPERMWGIVAWMLFGVVMLLLIAFFAWFVLSAAEQIKSC
ncbi:MAG: hypothetical protein JO170_30760 [Verrucomicrobia bacterium]|nr:hypothetical protein [Verrucomicrobiota bacterium]